MTANTSIDPSVFLHEQLAQASPDLMRELFGTFINALLCAQADSVCGAAWPIVSRAGRTRTCPDDQWGHAKKLLAAVRPRNVGGKTRRRVAAELVSDLERIYTRKKAANQELSEVLTAAGTTLTGLHIMGRYRHRSAA